MMASRFPGSFRGYTLEVVEAHQSTKARSQASACFLLSHLPFQVDTSGTAKALVASFQGMGVHFDAGSIVRVRDKEGQCAMGVPGAGCNDVRCLLL
jgi:4-hydroxy-tetrahydrodipicolinate reductase